MSDTSEQTASEAQKKNDKSAPNKIKPARRKHLDRLKAKVISGKYKISNLDLVKALFMNQ